MKLQNSFYSKYVHFDYYSLLNKNLKKAEMRILSEIKYFGLNKNFLKNKNVIDIGSGLQSLAFNKLGCKKIYHFDIDKKNIRKFKALCKKKGIKNIHSFCIDLSKEKINNLINDEIHLIFCCGIINHVNKLNFFFRTLFSQLSNQGYFYLRFYNCNSLTRQWNAFLRKYFSNSVKLNQIKYYLDKRYSKLIKNRFLNDLYDDLHVSIWKCFDKNHIKFCFSTNSTNINTLLEENKFDENSRLLFRKRNNSPIKKVKFLNDFKMSNLFKQNCPALYKNYKNLRYFFQTKNDKYFFLFNSYFFVRDLLTKNKKISLRLDKILIYNNYRKIKL